MLCVGIRSIKENIAVRPLRSIPSDRKIGALDPRNNYKQEQKASCCDFRKPIYFHMDLSSRRIKESAEKKIFLNPNFQG
jgi:hypothetical protein